MTASRTDHRIFAKGKLVPFGAMFCRLLAFIPGSRMVAIRDYSVEVREGERWKTIIEVTGNYQRRRSHAIRVCDPVVTMRIHVKQTNGLDHARIAQVRVYSNNSIWQRAWNETQT